MAFDYNQSPNFINPDYASPEQVSSLRDYAKQLMANSQQPVTGHWTQGVSNIVNALVGGYTGYQADKSAADARQKYAQQLMGAIQNPSADYSSAVPAITNPWASKEGNEFLAAATLPRQIPTLGGVNFVTPQGRRIGFVPTTVNQPEKYGNGTEFNSFFQGTPEGGVVPVPMGQPQNQPLPPSPPQAAQPVSPSVPQVKQALEGATGFQTTDSGNGKVVNQGTFSDRFNNTPTPSVPDVNGMPQLPPNASVSQKMDFVSKTGAERDRQKTMAEEGAKATMAPIAEAAKEARTAQSAIQWLDVIGDTVNRYGDKITTGPAAEGFLKIKQAINGIAGSDVMGSTAPAEAVKKMNAQLASAQLPSFTNRGTQFDLKTFMENNPGLSNSIEGTKFLVNVLKQAHNQQIQLASLASDRNNWNNWPLVQKQFYDTHPIINPMTGQPFAAEKQTSQADDGWKDMGGGVKIRPKQ